MTGERADLGIVMALAYAAFVDELRADLASAGYDDLNRAFGYVARALADGPMMLKDLGQRLGMTSQGAIKIIDDMERSGYVERTDDPEDGRAKRLRLTRRGRAALSAARRFHAEFEKRLATRVGHRAVTTLREVLEFIAEERRIHGAPPILRPV
jgi:DNA-binding MarR family transcriptional regulator